MKMNYKVELKSAGNPDLNQHAPLSPSKSADVADIHSAVNACAAYIRHYNLGGGNWIGGNAFDGHGKKIARISYNLRVWPVAS